MTTSTVYHTATLRIGGSAAGVPQVNLGSDAAGYFKLMWTNGYTFNNNHSAKAQITNEITQSEYTAGGISLTNVTFTIEASGTAKWDADDVAVSASGAALAANGHALYADGVTGDPLILFIDTQGTAEAGSSTQYRVVWNADGIIQIKP